MLLGRFRVEKGRRLRRGNLAIIMPLLRLVRIQPGQGRVQVYPGLRAGGLEVVEVVEAMTPKNRGGICLI